MLVVSKNDEFCIQNEELCINNEECCIKNEESCNENDEVCRWFVSNDDGFCTKNDGLCIQNDDLNANVKANEAVAEAVVSKLKGLKSLNMSALAAKPSPGGAKISPLHSTVGVAEPDQDSLNADGAREAERYQPAQSIPTHVSPSPEGAFCIRNDEFCIRNGDVCIKHDEF